MHIAAMIPRSVIFALMDQNFLNARHTVVARAPITHGLGTTRSASRQAPEGRTRAEQQRCRATTQNSTSPLLQSTISQTRHTHGLPRTLQTRAYRPSPSIPKYPRLELLNRDGTPWRVATSRNTQAVAAFAIAGACIFYFANLETVPVSGRTRFNCLGDSAVRLVGSWAQKNTLEGLKAEGKTILPDWDLRTVMVKRVMARLVPFSGMAGDHWEVHVIDDPGTANAFVLPGGKVFVYSGLLGVARTDAGLAAVLGHEIAHNVAGHVGERMSQDVGTYALVLSLVVLTGGVVLPWLGARALNVAFGNPMSRMQESEADYIGLMIMAQACYDPREAVRFWGRMEALERWRQQQGGEEVPEWLSTHPSSEVRMRKIDEWMSEAMAKREASDCRSTAAFADVFREALQRGVIFVQAF